MLESLKGNDLIEELVWRYKWEPSTDNELLDHHPLIEQLRSRPNDPLDIMEFSNAMASRYSSEQPHAFGTLNAQLVFSATEFNESTHFIYFNRDIFDEYIAHGNIAMIRLCLQHPGTLYANIWFNSDSKVQWLLYITYYISRRHPKIKQLLRILLPEISKQHVRYNVTSGSSC